jgi:hypothetical protein
MGLRVVNVDFLAGLVVHGTVFGESAIVDLGLASVTKSDYVVGNQRNVEKHITASLITPGSQRIVGQLDLVEK